MRLQFNVERRQGRKLNNSERQDILSWVILILFVCSHEHSLHAFCSVYYLCIIATRRLNLMRTTKLITYKKHNVEWKLEVGFLSMRRMENYKILIKLYHIWRSGKFRDKHHLKIYKYFTCLVMFFIHIMLFLTIPIFWLPGTQKC